MASLALPSTQIPSILHDTRQRSGASSLYDLPAELRNMIWELAMPHGRNIRVQVNTNTGTQRAYAPISIPSILHICQESRTYACGVYVLGFGSHITHEDKLWWNPEADRLFIPEICYSKAVRMGWDAGIQLPKTLITNFPHDIFNKMQHLALDCNWALLRSLMGEGIEWFSRFESLRTVSLLISPNGSAYSGEGKAMVLYEALDVPIIEDVAFLNYIDSDPDGAIRPSTIESAVARKIEQFRKDSCPGWDRPIFEIMVLGFKRMKKSDWCIPTKGRHAIQIVSRELGSITV